MFYFIERNFVFGGNTTGSPLTLILRLDLVYQAKFDIT